MTNNIETSVAAGFESRFGYAPSGLWSAPGRVNLIGEHTDYNDGFVFPFAIDRRTVLALAPRTDRVIRVASGLGGDAVTISLDALDPDTMDGWSAYVFGIVWALEQMGSDLSAVTGVDLYLDSTVPVGAGLSSSAAIECAVAVALNDTWGLDLSRRHLARVGQLAENKAVGAPTGIMDQSASLLGEQDAGVFLDCRTLDAQVVPLGFAEAGLVVLIIDTRVSHSHATGGYAARRASCEAGAAALGVESLRDLSVDDLPRASATLDDETFRRVRHVITENQRVLDTVRTLRTEGAAAIGALLDASHASMRDDFEISVAELDLAAEVAVAAGALGARMTGGGFGGAAIALVRAEDAETVTDAVTHAFASAGFRAPTIFPVTAAAGAGAL
jgi:galactokinase